MADLSNMRVAVIATDGFEESELTEPVKALKEAGAKVDIVSTKPGEIQGFKHHDKSQKVKVDRTLDEVQSGQYDAIMLPGGALNADTIRVQPRLKAIIQEVDRAGKPVAAICHAPWELISAGVAKGRTLTSYHTIQDDLRNSGANWVDQEVVVDRNLVTSRQPSDLPAFNREMLKLFSQMSVMRR
jgi:protease I